MACIETLQSESPDSGKMTGVCYFVILVSEWEFDLEAVASAPLIEATLDLKYYERDSGPSLRGRTRGTHRREDQGNSFVGHGVEFVGEPDTLTTRAVKPNNVDALLYDGMAVW